MPTDTNPVAIINSADVNHVAIIDSADANPVAIIDSGEPDDLSDFMNVVTSVSTEDLIKDDSLHSVFAGTNARWRVCKIAAVWWSAAICCSAVLDTRRKSGGSSPTIT